MKSLVVVFVLCFSAAHSQTYQMNVRLRDGTTTTIGLEDIRKITFEGVTSVAEGEKLRSVIRTFTLLQNYPNPFNPTTTIEYEVPHSGDVQIRVFNINGQVVRNLDNSVQTEGRHRVRWDASDDAGRRVASGVYFYQVIFENSVLAKKMMLLK